MAKETNMSKDAAASSVAKKYTVVREVRQDVLKLEEGREYVLRFEAPIRIGGTTANGVKSADVATVTNLEDGSQTVVIMNAAFKSTIVESYPNDTYVNKAFSVTNLGRVAGKRYKAFKVIEIDWKG